MLFLCECARATAKRDGKYDYPHLPSLFIYILLSSLMIASKNSKVVKRLEIVLHFGFIKTVSLKKVALH